MIKVDAAEIACEYVNHDEATVRFSTGGPDGLTVESVELDAVTWKRMGYPHFMTFVGKVTKQ